MKRAFAIAALAAGLFAFAGTTGATAGDYFHGGHHAYSGGHHGGNHHGSYAHSPVQTYGNYGYSSNYRRLWIRPNVSTELSTTIPATVRSRIPGTTLSPTRWLAP